MIELYLVLTYIPSPNTFFKDIYKLKPGHYIIANNDQIHEKAYWDFPEIDEDNLNSNSKLVYEEFEFLLKDSVSIRMRSDVSYGAFLSGGLDSSSIVSIMSEISEVPIETFTIGWDQKEYDESFLAQTVAEKYNTNHNLGTVYPSHIEDYIKNIVDYFDEPFGDNSAIATYAVSKFAADKVKMVLTGDGGDEVLSGYGSYNGLKFSRYFSKLPNMLRRLLSSGVGGLALFFSDQYRYKLNRVYDVFSTATLPFNLRYAHKVSFAPFNVIKKMTSGIRDTITIEDFISEELNKNPYKYDFYKLMHLNIKYDLSDGYLVKVDRMSMANSIETRAPFLDYRLMEMMFKVDKNVKLQGWETKSVLKKTYGNRLPKQILNASKKGFVVPVRDWFRSKENTHLLNLACLKDVCGRRNIDGIIAKNIKGEADYGYFLWSLVILNSILAR